MKKIKNLLERFQSRNHVNRFRAVMESRNYTFYHEIISGLIDRLLYDSNVRG